MESSEDLILLQVNIIYKIVKKIYKIIMEVFIYSVLSYDK